MFLKGFRVSYRVQHIWTTSTEQKHFLYEDKAKEFYKTVNAEAQKNNDHTVKLDEVAYVLIEGKPYCLGVSVDVLDLNRFDPK